MMCPIPSPPPPVQLSLVKSLLSDAICWDYIQTSVGGISGTRSPSLDPF